MLEEFIDSFMEDLARYEGVEGGDSRVEDSTQRANPYGLDNPPFPAEEGESPKSHAERVTTYFYNQLSNDKEIGDAYRKAPIAVQKAVLDLQYNTGNVFSYDKLKTALNGGDYKSVLQNTLDVVSANDDTIGSNAVSFGLAKRRAEVYNTAAKDLNLNPITSVRISKGIKDSNTNVDYNIKGNDKINFNIDKPIHSTSKSTYIELY